MSTTTKVLLEQRALRESWPARVEDQAGAVEDQFVIAADRLQ